MNHETANRTVIIAAIDRTAATDQVIYTATSLACAIAGAELHVVNVVDVGTSLGSTAVPVTETFREARDLLDENTRRVAERFSGRVAAHLSAGEPARRIVQLAADLQADLVVVGSHGKKALGRVLMGSVSMAVVKKAPCAVLVARPNERPAAPEIEPPCPKCLEVQQASGGEQLWCTQHSSRHSHGHLHYETPASFGVGSMFIRPDA